MLNLTELRRIYENAEFHNGFILAKYSSEDDMAFWQSAINHFRQLLDIADAAKRHSESFKNAHGVLILEPAEKQIEVTEAAERLDKLLEDVEIGDEQSHVEITVSQTEETDDAKPDRTTPD